MDKILYGVTEYNMPKLVGDIEEYHIIFETPKQYVVEREGLLYTISKNIMRAWACFFAKTHLEAVELAKARIAGAIAQREYEISCRQSEIKQLRERIKEFEKQ